MAGPLASLRRVDGDELTALAPAPVRVTGLVWCNGTLSPLEAASLRVDDHGVVVGDGVFETVATAAGVPFALGRHLDRLRRSAEGMGLHIGVDDAALRRAVDGVVTSHDSGTLRVRITVTGGPSPLGSARGTGPCTVIVAAAPLPPPAASAAVVVVPWTRNERGALSGLKTISYGENVVALAHAHRLGADEAIFANTAGELCEGTGSNVFVVSGGELVTPPLSSGCLAGVTRALVLEAGLAVERTLPLAALRRADEAFLTSTTRLAQPIRSVDGRQLPPSGPATAAVQAALAALVAATCEP